MTREPSRWAVGSNQYVKRAAANQSGSGSAHIELSGSVGSDPLRAEQLAATGISWIWPDTSDIKQSGVERSRHRFRGVLPELIWNAAALEGNNFTLPEVRTLLDGVTIGGQRTEDEQQILALSQAYSELDRMVGAGEFRLDRDTTNALHAIVARHEAVESGHFRGEGVARGGGTVSLASGGNVPGLEHGAGGELLIDRFDALHDYLSTLDDPRERALAYFAAATRSQFYFDGNKRTARLMMTGELMANGYEAVNIPFARRLEFNQYLDTLFMRDDATDLLVFLISCAD